MFNFFRKKPALKGSFSFLRTDMHSHLIPGIDDGARDIETSVALIREMYNMGFTSLITTPHIMSDLYPNTPEIILAGLETVRQAVKAEGIEIEINAAAEYLMDETFAEKIEADNLLTLIDKYVLIEMSFISPPPNADELLFQLQTKGYRPVMAHPERYLYLHGSLAEYERLKERGCLLQLNLLSMVGYYGRDVKQTAIKMLKAGLFDLAGTDLHHMRHRKALEDLLEDIKTVKLLMEYRWQNTRIFRDSSLHIS